MSVRTLSVGQREQRCGRSGIVGSVQQNDPHSLWVLASHPLYSSSPGTDSWVCRSDLSVQSGRVWSRKAVRGAPPQGTSKVNISTCGDYCPGRIPGVVAQLITYASQDPLVSFCDPSCHFL